MESIKQIKSVADSYRKGVIKVQLEEQIGLAISDFVAKRTDDKILQNLVEAYIQAGGTEEKLQELFTKGGLKTAFKRAGAAALSAALVASPIGTPLKRTGTIPAVPGSDGSPAVVQPATPDKVIPGTTAKPTGKFVISGEKDLKTGKAKVDPKSPSGLKRGSDQIEIDDAVAAQQHSVPGSLTHKQATDAITTAASKSTPDTVIPGTPAKTIKPAVPAQRDIPSKTTFAPRSFAMIPNPLEYTKPDAPQGVQQGDAFAGIRRRRRTNTTTTSGGGTTPVTGGGGAGGGGSSGGGLRPYPQPVPPTPVLGRMSVGTRSTNLQRGGLSPSNPGQARSISGSANNPILMKKVAAARGEQASWTTGISTPVVGTQAAFRSVPSIRPRPKGRFEEETDTRTLMSFRPNWTQQLREAYYKLKESHYNE